MKQYLIPGYGYVNEALDKEYLVPGHGYVNETGSAVPLVESAAASSVGETTARLNGNLTSMGSETAVDVYFEYKELGAGSWEETSPVEKTGTGEFYADVSSLDAGTDYEFRAVVLYDTTEKAYGSTLTFKTTGGVTAGGLFFCNG